MNDLRHVDDVILNDYLDELLDPDTRKGVDQHLATCPACAAQVAEFRVLFTALESLPPLVLERDLAPAVVAAIRPAPVPPYAARTLRRVLVAQLALAAVLVLALWQMVLPNLGEAQLAAQTWWATVDLTPMLIQVQMAWDAFVTPMQAWREIALSDVVAIPALSWTTATGLFVVAAVVWLAGNRWLLAPVGVVRP